MARWLELLLVGRERVESTQRQPERVENAHYGCLWLPLARPGRGIYSFIRNADMTEQVLYMPVQCELNGEK